MQTLVLSVVSLWIFADSSVNGALNISYTGSNKLQSTDYVLKCDISAFTGLAAWSRDGNPMTSCTNSMCFTTTTPPYNFRQDSSAIYVDFSILDSNEDGIQWVCEHVGDTAVDFNVQIHSSSTDTECGWCSIECGHRRWCIALIVMVIALLAIVPIFLTISMKREYCCFSNDFSITGNRCLGSHIACLHFDSRVSDDEPNVSNQTPNSGRPNVSNQTPSSGRNLNDVRPLPNIGEQH